MCINKKKTWKRT